jgi:predicted NUDIX family NTP pyrophosphohydrolase
MKKHSAGLIVYRQMGDGIEVLIAHMGSPWWAKKDAGAWSIPKGEYQENEDPEANARREFKEELGKDVPNGKWLDLGTVEQKNNKTVLAWAVEGDLDVSHTTSNKVTIEWPPRSGKMQEFPEIDRAAYFPLNLAAQKLVPAQVELLERLAQKLGTDMHRPEEPAKPSQPSLF